MAVKVNLGEVKTQEVKPFPKLMSSVNGTIIEVLTQPDHAGNATVIVRVNKDHFRLGLVEPFCVIDGPVKFSDYNEPIIIQNA